MVFISLIHELSSSDPVTLKKWKCYN